MSIWRKLLANTLGRAGYRVQKYPRTPFPPAPVFDIAVQLLMATRGPAVEFVQVGANDGRRGDPLRKYLVTHPWRGVLVEPQPDVFAELRAAYVDVDDRLAFENVAISPSGAEIAMYRAAGHASTRGDRAWAASVVSTRPEVAARQLGVKQSELERVVVPCTTLDALVARYDLAGIQLLQIDTEGHDLEVLRTLDLARVTPAVVQFEHGHLRPAELDAAVALLTAHGYRTLYGGHQMDTVAVHETFVAEFG